MNREDPFGGTWKLNSEKSHFDSNHKFSAGTMRWERTGDGYVMKAEGTHDGQVVQERPQTLILDGKEHAVPGQPDITVVASSPTPKIIHVEAKNTRCVVGTGSYVVSEDGTVLTATMAGTDAQHQPFRTEVVWDRQ